MVAGRCRLVNRKHNIFTTSVMSSMSSKTGGLCHDPEIGIYKWSKRFPNEAALWKTDDFSKHKRCCECIWDPFGSRRRGNKLILLGGSHDR